jgi:D12 class N6 adenine-specific DNA methyltransferase
MAFAGDFRSNDGSSIPAAKPFLRWAGSKRKQLGRLGAFWSQSHTGYVEPFAGSACLFFSIAPPRAVLGDANLELVEVYDVVRDNPERLYARLCTIRRDLETYKEWRALRLDSLDRETRALRFVYLNRNCFNGIYRTNSEGHFNVPMGKRSGVYFTKQDLLRCSELLRRPVRRDVFPQFLHRRVIEKMARVICARLDFVWTKLLQCARRHDFRNIMLDRIQCWHKITARSSLCSPDPSPRSNGSWCHGWQESRQS